MGVDRFGVSAPYETIYREFGLTTGNIVDQAVKLLHI